MIFRSKQWIAILFLAATALTAIGASIAWAQQSLAESTTDAPNPVNVAQQQPTAVPLEFPTLTPTLGPPTDTPTRTPTPPGLPKAEALSSPTNVRSSPDITSTNKIGEIQPGTQYEVLGQYFEWYFLAVPEVSGGRAWVHNSVVTLDGDPAAVPQFDDETRPTADSGLLAIQETALAITQTPGAGATLTAQALITPTGIFNADPNAEATLAPGERLPTYTHPAATVTPIPFPRTNPPSEASGLAPIVPILALGALGLMGLLVSIMRRL